MDNDVSLKTRNWLLLDNFNDLIETTKEVCLFLSSTNDEYAEKVADNLKKCGFLTSAENYINFSEASIILSEYGKSELSKLCFDIAFDFGIEARNCTTEMIHRAVIFDKFGFLRSAPKDRAKPTIKDKYLYVLEFTNGTVKIGITKEKEKRKKAISSASGMEITREYFTRKISNVHELETALHRHFKDNRLKGEFFKIPFDVAVKEVQKRERKILKAESEAIEG